MKYVFREYQSDYPVIADNEIKKLRKFFPTACIEHFGSTSVPGLGGKGIIDIYMAVGQEFLAETKGLIEKIGYEHKPAGGVTGERWYFSKNQKVNSRLQGFHLHLTAIGNQNMADCLIFRDYLKSHPEDAKEYSEIKHAAVAAAKKFKTKKDKKKAYMDIKEPIIQKIMKKMKLDLINK